MRFFVMITSLAAALLIAGCAEYYVIPQSFEEQLDRTMTFSEIKQDPEKYKGRTIALGGVVLKANHLKDGTLIEVLQLPLNRADRPVGMAETSEGRFLILDPDHRDPAVLQNRRVTVVGEVIGKKVQTIDEFEYAYPYLSAKFIQIWREVRAYYDYPPYPYYYPPPYPYWYPPYWYYPYVPPPVIIQPQPREERRFESPSAPTVPAPKSPSGSKRRFED